MIYDRMISGDRMKTIQEVSEFMLEVEKSQFYAYFIPIQKEEEARQKLDILRKSHPKARHCCYAYRLENAQKSSDDGEPKGTAGRPLLELLTRHDFVDSLIVVVRYFGGVKLGAGRLLRTYVDAASRAIEKAKIYQKMMVYVSELTFSPSLYHIVVHQLASQNIRIVDTQFEESITMEIESEEDVKDVLFHLYQSKVEIHFKEMRQTFKEVNKNE